jgi:phage FluMu protein Com
MLPNKQCPYCDTLNQLSQRYRESRVFYGTTCRRAILPGQHLRYIQQGSPCCQDVNEKPYRSKTPDRTRTPQQGWLWHIYSDASPLNPYRSHKKGH